MTLFRTCQRKLIRWQRWNKRGIILGHPDWASPFRANSSSFSPTFSWEAIQSCLASCSNTHPPLSLCQSYSLCSQSNELCVVCGPHLDLMLYWAPSFICWCFKCIFWSHLCNHNNNNRPIVQPAEAESLYVLDIPCRPLFCLPGSVTSCTGTHF